MDKSTIRFNDYYYPAYISYIKGNFTNVDKTISDSIFKYNNGYIVCSNYGVRGCVEISKNKGDYNKVFDILNDLKNGNITTNHGIYLDFLGNLTKKYKNQIINIVDNGELINDK